MEYSLEELVKTLSQLLKDHPNATICAFDDSLIVEDGTKTSTGGHEEVFKITSDPRKSIDDGNCLTVAAF